MFSFRRDQFRAILWGLLIADAVSHQFLTWPPAYAAQSPRDRPHKALPLQCALTNNSWCQQITTTFDGLVALAEQGQPLTPGALTVSSAQPRIDDVSLPTPALLAQLPGFLLGLDTPLSSPPVITEATADLSIRFYEAMVVLLNTPSTTEKQRWLATQLVTPPTAATSDRLLTAVYQSVWLAGGDFSLAVGQSQYGTAPGEVLLSGLLSAGWSGCKGIPSDWFLRLKMPTPSLQNWLQQRWQIAQISQVEKWAEVLWQHWLGRYSPYLKIGEMSRYPVIQRLT